MVVKVRAEGGASLAGVAVCAGDSNRPCHVKNTTASNGLAVLRDIAVGKTVRVFTKKKGYELAEKTFVFRSNSGPVNLFMRPIAKQISVPRPDIVPVVSAMTINGNAKSAKDRLVQIGFNANVDFNYFCLGNPDPLSEKRLYGPGVICRGVTPATQFQDFYDIGNWGYRVGYNTTVCVRVRTWSEKWSNRVCDQIKME
ncbi:MAG: hypothetical protein GXP16_02585 [Gammaproteobacteria bacterium]|nr:hypothetical protein [Gammaproteobacteria bacterium]